MAVKIRLKRIGRKKQPTYRIVVMESRNPRDGKVIETVGTYTPYRKDKPFAIKLDRVEEWRSKGAKPTEAVLTLLRRARRESAGPVAAPEAEKVSETAEDAVPVEEASGSESTEEPGEV